MNKIDISLLFLSKDSALRQAIACIDKGGLGIAMVVDDNQHLLGTITDGDIRRAILAGDEMESQIQRILERKSATIYPKPVTAPKSASKSEILGLMKKWVLRHVPLLDDEGQVVDLVTMDELLPSEKLSLQAVVLAGGEQTRLHPLAADLPRPMLPIGNRPLMEYTINQLRQAGIEEVSLTTHYKADAVVDYFKDGSDFGVHINYLDENEPSGIMGGLRLLEKKDAPLLVINGDVLTKVDFRAMLAYHQEQQAEMTVAVRLHDFAIPYEVIETLDGQVSGVVEKPSFQRFINAGAYLLSPEILELIPQGQAFDMKDLITQLAQAGRRVVSFPIHEYWREIQGYADYQQAVVDVKNGLFADLALAVASMEPGAPPPAGFVPLCVPELHGNEWAYIKECLDTNWVSSVGPFVDRFEESVAAYTGRKYGVATSSGTAALHIALLVAGVQPNDEVLLSDLTFIAPANAVRYINAWPVFIDVESLYWQMDPQKLADFLKNDCRWVEGKLHNRTTGKRVSAIIPVHILGHPCDMDPILELAHQYNLAIIEDASESLGAKYKGRMVGNLGDIACFSFNGNKIITTGGGGMIVTDNDLWAQKARYLTTQAKDDPLEFKHNEIGFNYRLTNIQSAMGCAQMEQLDDYIAAKRRIAGAYTNALADLSGITPMHEAPWAYSTFWLYTVLVDKQQYGMDSRALLKRLIENGIQSRPLWQPLHRSIAHADGHPRSGIVADRLNQCCLSLPCSVGLTSDLQEKVVEIIKTKKTA